MNCDFLIVSINSEGKEDLPFNFEMLSAGLFLLLLSLLLLSLLLLLVLLQLLLLLLLRRNMKNIFLFPLLSLSHSLSHSRSLLNKNSVMLEISFFLSLAKNNFSVKYLK